MKKVLSVLLVCILFIGSSLSVKANEEEIKSSYEKVKEYYEEKVDTLYYLDEIIALGNANVDLSIFEVSGDYNITQDFKMNLEEGILSTGNLAKHILACIFMEENPIDVEGENLVELLESFVSEDGSVEGCYDVSDLVWVLYALESVESEKAEIVADKIASFQQESDTSEGRSNNKGGFGQYYVSLDSSAWVVEALMVLNEEKYVSVCENAVQYFNRKQLENSGYKPDDDIWEGMVYAYTPNTDTQSNVIRALLSYDKEGLLEGKYNKNESVFSVVLENQLEDGSFSYNGEEESNEWSTYSALWMLSTYYEGNFVQNAQLKYQKMNSSDTAIKLSISIFGLAILGVVLLGKKRKEE